jgi:hypothetical protein
MAKRFYLAVRPLEPRLTLVVARKASGKEFARVPVPALLYETARPEPKPQEEGPPARSVIELETAEGVATLSASAGQDGARCWRLAAIDIDPGTCAEAPAPLVAGVEQVGSGEHALVLLHGAGGPNVRSLELRYEDGAKNEIRLLDGFFLFEVPRDRWSVRRQPAVLVARAASGNVLARKPVVQGP